MADTAANLVDRVFPIVPVRQWVLSLPFALRHRMAYAARLISDVLNVFIRALFGDLQRRAHEQSVAQAIYGPAPLNAYPPYVIVYRVILDRQSEPAAGRSHRVMLSTAAQRKNEDCFVR